MLEPLILSLALLNQHFSPVQPESLGPGFCEADSGNIDLHRVYFLDGNEVEWGDSDALRLFELDNRNVYIVHDQEEIAIPLTLVRNINEDMDIVARFSFFDGRLYVYWRETYLNRQFQQGLIHVDGLDLVEFCYGTGGIVSAH